MSQGNNQSSNSTKREEKPELTIPTDLIIEIFSRLPGNSIARFRCLSKLWSSTLRRPYFTELFLTRSSARPRLLFVLKKDFHECTVFSSPQPHNPYGKSSLVVTADFHMKIRGHVQGDNCSYTSGLIYFQDIWIKGIDEWDTQPVICNPITGRYAILPVLMRYQFIQSNSALGFDPIHKQFKVVDHHKILTLGNGKLGWRSKSHPVYVESLCQGICIKGVCYFFVERGSKQYTKILCVDVRSEEFKFIDAEYFCDKYKVKLVNYKGRLGGLSLEYNYDYRSREILELCMCVLEDVETQEWSKSVYSLGENAPVCTWNDYIFGVTAAGEIVLSKKYITKLFYVFYFSPERNILQKVEIRGLTDYCSVQFFVDHVEDIDVNDANQLSRPVMESLKIIRKRPEPPKQPNPQKQHTSSRDLGKTDPYVKNKQPTILLQNKYELLADRRHRVRIE